MSELSQGWATTRIGELTSKIGSGATPRGGAKAYKLSGTPLLRSLNIHFDGVRDKGIAFIDEEQAAKLDNVQVETADVLLNITGASIGRVAIAPERYEGARVNQHVAIIRTVDGVEPSFLSRYLASPDAQARILEENYGVTRQALTKGMIEDFPVYLPPLPEQRRIVAKLDRLSARSAAARDLLARTTKLATRAKQAILAHAFQGGLVDGSSIVVTSVPPRDELIRLRDERRTAEGLRKKGKNRSVPISSAVLPDVPGTWQWLTFDDCSWDMTVGHVGPMKDRYVEDGIPFLRSLNVKPNAISSRDIRYIDTDFDEELRKSRLLPGDLVVVRTGEPGVAAVIDENLGLCNCSDLVISRLCQFIDPHFAAYYMNSNFARHTSSAMQVGVAQRHFNVGAMSVMPVPLPPIEEQVEIVRRIEAAFARIDRMTEEASRAAHLLDRLDERLLAKAFRGKLVPQDPDDEPAEALLTRIREARAAAPKAERGRRKKIDAE
ncbi:restriction endonuclease subunit S [Sulfitobacter sp.]|uniref:restriction endonuclease subunit S n=1 Tax=Sulfitobacter sp. TaxID=1903071 RepID=UPI0032980DE5